jgi:hypothetical protein
MKTTLRFYHPVPALTQHGNIQDVPRIRLILKSVELGGDGKGIPSTPSEILAQLVSRLVHIITLIVLTVLTKRSLGFH